MADKQYKDKAGGPVVAITGMGVITSLGTGKDDNWKKLTAGESGIRKITRFPTDDVRTTIAGTIDTRATSRHRAVGHHHADREIGRRRGDCRSRHRLARRFSRPDVPRDGADRDRVAAPLRSRIARPANDNVTYDRTIAARRGEQRFAASTKWRNTDSRREPRRSFRHQGRADFAYYRLRVRRDRDPARRRGDPPRRDRGGALRSAPTARSTRKPSSASRCSPRFRRRTIRRRPGLEAVLKEPRRFRASRKARRRWCWKTTITPSRAARKFSASFRAAARRPTISTARAPARTARRSSAHAQ